jgi:hypothetical protein
LNLLGAYGGTSVVYFFLKSGRYVQCVMDVIDDVWQLTVTEPGSPDRSEFFDAPDDVAARWASVQHAYRAAGWDGPLGRDQRI